MERKLFGVLSGAQVTIIALAAILTPAALFASVTFSNVAVINPTTGVAAAVDSAGRLSAVNPYSVYRDFPAYQIDLTVSNSGGGCETAQQWTVPSGKAFVITAMSGYEEINITADPEAGVIVFSGAACSGKILTAHTFMSASTSVYKAPVAVDYGVGIPVPPGSVVSVFSNNNAGATYLHGYLVPAAWVTSSQIIGSTLKAGAAGAASPGR